MHRYIYSMHRYTFKQSQSKPSQDIANKIPGMSRTWRPHSKPSSSNHSCPCIERKLLWESRQSLRCSWWAQCPWPPQVPHAWSDPSAKCWWTHFKAPSGKLTELWKMAVDSWFTHQKIVSLPVPYEPISGHTLHQVVLAYAMPGTFKPTQPVSEALLTCKRTPTQSQYIVRVSQYGMPLTSSWLWLRQIWSKKIAKIIKVKVRTVSQRHKVAVDPTRLLLAFGRLLSSAHGQWHMRKLLEYQSTIEWFSYCCNHRTMEIVKIFDDKYEHKK